MYLKDMNPLQQTWFGMKIDKTFVNMLEDNFASVVL